MSHPIFDGRSWELDVVPPWRAKDCEHCIELIQPEGVGAVHISSSRKKDGIITGSEILSLLKKQCQDDAEFEEARCGEFTGHAASYTDWHNDTCWKKWFVARGNHLLFITYNRPRDDEDLETDGVSSLLSSLRSREAP